MRLGKLMVPLFVVALVAAGCGGDDDDDDAASSNTTTTEQTGGAAVEALCDTSAATGDNTGTVDLMSAGQPNEVEAYQGIFDQLISSETDYDVEVESIDDIAQQNQIRAEGG
jgi:ABC-type glycerol-3-phosphate transport system substrate-binding protein